MKKKGEEREDPRAPLRAYLRTYVRGKSLHDSFCSISENISTTGILLVTAHELIPGERIHCSFVLQHKISLGGEVVRAEKKKKDLYHYGVRFLDVDPKAKAQIEELIKDRE